MSEKKSERLNVKVSKLESGLRKSEASVLRDFAYAEGTLEGAWESNVRYIKGR